MSTKRKFSDFQIVPTSEGRQGSFESRQQAISSTLPQDKSCSIHSQGPAINVKSEIVTPTKTTSATAPKTPSANLSARPVKEHQVAVAPAAEYKVGSSPDMYIQLNISDTAIRYFVSSETLRLASNVWAALLNYQEKPLKNGKIDGSKETTYPFINLQNDDPEALFVFLRIIHLETDKIPRKLSFPQLRSIAELCDKYNCVRALGLWKDLWLNQFNLEGRLHPGREVWLVIDSIFGNKGPFLQLMQTIIRESGLRGKGNPTELLRCKKAQGSGKNDSEVYISITKTNDIPASIIDDITAQREVTILNLILIARTYLSHLEWKPPADGPARLYDCWDRCLVMAYGCFARDAQRLGVWRLLFTSRATLKTHPESPADLFERLRKIQFLRYYDVGSRSLEPQCPNGARSCGLASIQADYENALQDILHRLNKIPVDQYMKYKEDKQAKWETIKLPSSFENKMNMTLSFENKMNMALQNHGRNEKKK